MANILWEAAKAGNLVIHWPDLYPKVPGTEADDSHQKEIDSGFKSRTMVVMERLKLTREEAEKHIEQVAKDLKREQELFGETDLKKAENDAKAAGMMAKATGDDAQDTYESDESD